MFVVALVGPTPPIYKLRVEGERRQSRRGLSGREGWGEGVVGITAAEAAGGWAIHRRERRPVEVERKERDVQKQLLTEKRSPSPHGGRGALPSEGGSPSDLLFLAGGGSFFSASRVAVSAPDLFSRARTEVVVVVC